MFMTMGNLSPTRLPKIRDQESWTLSWRSFSSWGSKRVTISFAYIGSQYCVFDYMQPITPRITQDIWPSIINAWLTLIFMMAHGAFYGLFCLKRQPILRLWPFATYRHPDYARYITKNCWRFIDIHFATGVSTICNQLIWRGPLFTLIWAAFLTFTFTFFLITTLFCNNTYKYIL